jgi:transposase, IS6 family
LHLLRVSPSRQTVAMRTRRPRPATVPRSAFACFCFPPDVIVLAVRWYLRFALSYRDVEELLAERGAQVDHVTVYRWGSGSRRCSPRPPGPAATLSATAGRSTRPMSRWLAGGATSTARSTSSGRSSTCSCPRGGTRPRPVGSSNAPSARHGSRQSRWVTDHAPVYPVVLGELLPAAWHRTDRYATTKLRPTTAASSRGCVRCAGSSRTATPGS